MAMAMAVVVVEEVAGAVQESEGQAPPLQARLQDLKPGGCGTLLSLPCSSLS
jgi:hypothetical protein